MEPRNHRLGWLAAALLLMPVTPTSAFAQAAFSQTPEAHVIVTSPTRAEEMEMQGMRLLRYEDRWLASAVLLEAAALLRPDPDPRAITLLEVAGRIYHHAGEVERARLTLLTVGELAAKLAQPRRAADAYLAAAEIAQLNGMTREAITALVRAYELSQAPELNERDRISIWRRLGLHDAESLRVAGNGS